MGDKKRKKNKLTHLQRQKLHEIAKEEARANQEAQAERDRILKSADQERMVVRRECTDATKPIREEFVRQRKSLDKWLASQKKLLENEFGKKLDGLRTLKSDGYALIEMDMNERLEQIDKTEETAISKVNSSLDKKLNGLAIRKEHIEGSEKAAKKDEPAAEEKKDEPKPEPKPEEAEPQPSA